MAADQNIVDWLTGLGLGAYADTFRQNDIDFRSMPYLNEVDLRELGMSLGHRKLLLNAVQSLDLHAPKAPAATATKTDTAALTSRQPTQMLPSPAADAERRQITVMFCDLVGSTELSRRLDPEELREVLGRYREIVAESVARYDGYVAQFLGDGVLAYFGWPIAYEDQAERAVHAALDVVAAVKRYARTRDEPIRVRLGIETGEVVVGKLAANATTDSESATGETPNRAARLQGVAQANQVVVGLNTRQLIGNVFVLDELSNVSLRGFDATDLAWAVLGESGAEGRFSAAHNGQLGRLIGRQHELGSLSLRWQNAVGAEGQVVSVSGEAGIGKSGLIQAFRKDIVESDYVDIYFQCSAHHTNSAFYPLIQQLQRAARFESSDDNDQKLDKLEALLGGKGRAQADTVSLFSSLLSVSADERFGPLELTPQQLRHRTIEALINQLLFAAERRPVLVIIEDIHWIDPSMQEFVEAFIPRLVDARIFLIVSYRTEMAPAWVVNSSVAAISLTRLERRHAEQIARSVAGSDIPDSIIGDIVQRAEGVPLFVEEVTKAARENIESTGDRFGALGVPATLQSSLVSRLDRLGSAKDIAQIGAVIGRDFSYPLVAQIAGWAEADLDEALERLVKAELVYRRGVKPNTTFTFKHALVQDAAYGTMLLSRRRALHARISDELKSLPDQAGNEATELIGYHAFQAEIWDTAFRFLSNAGKNAMDRAAVREAVGQYERGLQAASRLERSRELDESVIDLRFDLRNALWSIGEFEKILKHLRDAESVATDLNDHRRLGWISVFRSASYWQLGLRDETLTAANLSVDIADNVQDLSLAVGARFYLGCAQVTSGDLPKAEELFGKVIDTVSGELSRDRCGLPFVPSVVARSWLVWSLAERGEFETGLQTAEVALEIAKEIGNPFNLAHIYYDLGYLHAIRGEYDEAVEAQGNAMSLITQWKLTYLEPFIGGFLGNALFLAGHTDDALSELELAMSRYESVGLGLFRSLITAYYAQALHRAGDVERAMTVGQEAVMLAERRHERGHQAHALAILAEVVSDTDGSSDQTKKLFVQSRDLAANLGMRPLQAHCSMALARLARQTGDVNSPVVAHGIKPV